MPPGGLGEHLQGQMRYQQICWDSLMNNFLLIGMCHQQPQHQGPKGGDHVPPGGLREHLTPFSPWPGRGDWDGVMNTVCSFREHLNTIPGEDRVLPLVPYKRSLIYIKKQ